MEIILLKDVEHVGMANQICTVKAGYARNYLIPQGMAIVANKANKNSLMQSIKQQEERAAQMLQEAKELAAKLSEKTLKIAAKAGTSGKIFGSVTNVQIAAALKDVFGVDVERKNIKLTEEVKTLGAYTANIALHKEVITPVKFEVFDDKAEATTTEE